MFCPRCGEPMTLGLDYDPETRSHFQTQNCEVCGYWELLPEREKTSGVVEEEPP